MLRRFGGNNPYHGHDQPFRLLEHLGYAIYQTIKEHMPTAQLGIDVKKQPPIRNLTGGVAFYFGD